MLLPFVAGITLMLVFDKVVGALVYVTGIAWLLLLFYLVFSKRLWSYSTRWLYGSIAAIFMFALGYCLAFLHNESQYLDHFSKIPGARVYLAEVKEPLTEKEHTYKTILKVKSVISTKGVFECSGNLLCYFRKDSSAVYPEFGQTVLIAGEPAEIEGPKNPGAFDYKRYMASANVYQQVFLNSGQWNISKTPVKWSVKGQAQTIREYFLKILKDNNLTGQEYAVAAALILGQEDNLDAETYQDYAGAGVMHILSVSGLHVGIVYLVLNFILGFLNRNRKTLIIKTVIIIIAIWFYALITGFSPSVARSAAMFSIVLVAFLVDRNSHIINSLAISALVLLAYNPYYLLNIGFQLSYIAVAGIVFLYDWIYQRISPSTWLGDKIWQMVAVSLAAQIATVPVSLFYFHQFPSYFLAANIVAIPLSSLVIYSGMLVLVTSFIPSISGFFGYITALLLKLLNGSIAWIENLPFAVLSGIPFRMNEMIVLYLALIFIVIAVAFRNKRSFLLSIISLLIFIGLRIDFALAANSQTKIIVFDAGKSSVIELVEGTKSYVFADSLFISDQARQNQLLGRSNTSMGIRKSVILWQKSSNETVQQYSQSIAGAGSFYLFNNRRMAILDDLQVTQTSSEPLKVDYLVLSGNIKGNLQELLNLYEPGCIIMDNKFPYRRSLQWIADAKAAGIEIHSVKQDGAFIADI
jgi:competence protein ComEC